MTGGEDNSSDSPGATTPLVNMSTTAAATGTGTSATARASAAPQFSIQPQQQTMDKSVLAKEGGGGGHSHGNSGHSHGNGHGHSHGPAAAAPAAHQHGPQCAHGHEPSPVTPSSPPAPAAPLTPLEELFLCAKTNNLARFQEILANQQDASSPPLVEQRDAQGHTLAHWIAQRSSGEFLEYAASRGAPLDLPSEDAVKLHPIHWACSTGNLPALKAFVKLGVDINTVDETKHRTPLLISAQNGFPLLVMYCVKHGADVTLVDIDRDSAIHWAAYKGATEIVSVFQYLGLSTDEQDRYGQTPLHLAAMRGEFGTVQYLVEELESDLQIVDANGRTPLQLAKLKGYDRVAKYLAKRQFRAKWNVLSWWESSRAPFYFVLAMIPVTLIVYLRLVMPYMPELRSFYVLHLLWNALTWCFFFLTKRTNAGDLSKDQQYKDEYNHVTEELVHGSGNGNLWLLERPLCHSCHIQRPLRAKHCRVCKTCVNTFDHHCPFVDNCVGRGNYVYFMGFVGGMAVNCLLLEYVLYLQWLAHGVTWWIIGCMLFGGAMFLPVAHLFVFHCYLTAKNLTTNEVVNTNRYQYLRGADGEYKNHFDQGVLVNCGDRCLPEYAPTGTAKANSGSGSSVYHQEEQTLLSLEEGSGRQDQHAVNIAGSASPV